MKRNINICRYESLRKWLIFIKFLHLNQLRSIYLRFFILYYFIHLKEEILMFKILKNYKHSE